VDQALLYYSSVHRGSGFKSLLSTYLYDKARQVAADFVGADLDNECVIFGKNATEAINKLANRFPFKPGEVVLTTVMEHHSNDLPWRARAETLYAGLNPDGSLDVGELEDILRRNKGRVRLVAVTGASNVTGYLPPIYDIAEIAHQNGAMILADCAQLLPHRSIQMGASGTLRHLDFIAFSAHKVYAPYGTGALIGPNDFFNRGEPDYRGGGTVEIVTLEEVQWTHAPERDEAGSPNVIGAVALAAALEQLNEVGMHAIAKHESELTSYTLRCLLKIPGLKIYGSDDPSRSADRIGVIPFELIGMPHAKLAAILSFEGAIGLRNGCFCAHPYVLRLLGITQQEYLDHRSRLMQGDRSHLPGFVRLSFGCYNNRQDVDRLEEMLERIVQGDYRGEYIPHKPSGSYYPRGFTLEQLSPYFSF
jgi:selenocysteine lyase/cysteine desulfurase